MQVKRRRSGTNYVYRPRKRTKYVRKTRMVKRRYAYKRRYTLSKPQTNYLKAGTLAMVARKIHIPFTQISTRFNKRVMRVGNPHYLHGLFSGVTATSLGSVTNSIRFEPSLSVAEMANGANWTSTATNWGSTDYTALYTPGLNNLKQAYLAWMKLTVVIDSANENCKVRICIAKPRRQLASTLTRLSAWDPNVDSPHQALDKWEVMYTKFINFTDMVRETGVTHNPQRTVNIYLPFARMIRYTGNLDPSTGSSWNGNQLWSDYSYLIIDSNDATDVDGELCNVRVYYEAKFYELI